MIQDNGRAMLGGSLISILLKIFSLFSPKHLYNLLLVRTDDGKRDKIFPTSWLDGMRGYASVFVSLYHLRMGFTDTVHRGYGARPEDTNLYTLPFLRILFAGQAMVAVFYIVSGFSLAWGPLKELRDGTAEKCLEKLRSSIFRRYFRLFLPVMACTLIVAICMSLGLYDIEAGADPRTSYKEPLPEIKPDMFQQLGDWYTESWKFLNVLTGQDRHLYYVHSWSVSIEFRYSMMLYVAMVALNRFRLWPRFIGLIFCSAYIFQTRNMQLWSFFVGATLCQFTLWWSQHKEFVRGFPHEAKSIKEDAGWIFCLLVGLWMISYPEWMNQETPGYGPLQLYRLDWSEPEWFWYSVGAGLVCLASSNNTKVQWLFSCDFARYLGRISYALYLIHGIVIHVFALRVLPIFLSITGNTGLRWEIGFLLYLCVHVPITFMCASVFTRIFDDGAIKFAKWFDVVVSIDSASKQEYQVLPTQDFQLNSINADEEHGMVQMNEVTRG